MQRFAQKILFILTLILLFSQNSFAENPPKREFRGVWFTTVWGNDWPSNPGTSNQSTQKAELLKYIDALEDLNISTICFQVRGMSDAMYQSSTLPDGLQIPWSQYLSGTNNRGVSPGWDPLAYVVQECHNRGIEVYAWINPFRWANGSTEWTTTYDKTIKNKGWLMSNGTTTVLNPGIPEVRQHITYICKDIISRYSIEGIIFDDYFYPNGGTPESSEAPDYTHWINSGTSLSFGDWRRQNVDLTIESIYDMIQETRPEVRLVAGPSPLAGASASKYGLTLWPNGYDNQYSTLYSDPLSWMDKRIVDMMATQIYWHRDHKLAPYNTITDWWYSLAKHFDLHNCVSMNVYDFETTMSNQADLGKTTAHYDEHVANILASREYAAKYGVKSTGVNFYDTRHLVSVKSGYDYQEHGQYLRDNCFQRKSITPEIHWKNTPIYNAVNNLAYSSGTLSWTAAPIPTGAHSLTTIRYTVYAIPNSVNYESAITDDGFDGEYFQGISYSPSYTLASGKQSGYWYAVCVFDGYGNEHAPAIYNYTGGTSAQVTLTSPANNGLAGWEQTFSWSAVNGATYQLLVSEYENFSNVLLNVDNLTTTSTTLNLESLVEGKTYYWKVISKESGKIATDSEIYSFEVSPLASAPLAQLESPANGESVKNDVSFTWSNADEHVTAFTFQIATDANFSNIITSQDFDKVANGSNSTTINVNGMASGTYYWRVISKGRIYFDSPSAAQTFVIAELPTIDITLTSPVDGYTIVDNVQHFEWSSIEGATFLFELATDAAFNHVLHSKELSTNSYDFDLSSVIYNSTYYWRITAYCADHKDTTSEINTLISSAEYAPMGDLTIENLWSYSINDEENPLPEDINANCRSMAVDKDNIYITRRNSDNTLNLLVFDNKTGKLKQTITLIGSCESHKAYGANGVFVDAGGNVCVTSIGMSSTTQLTVCTVDMTTGETTNIFSYGEPNLRIDYVNFLGDVTKKGGQIWAAASQNDNVTTNNNRIYRWTNNGDKTWTTESSVINSFYPTDKQIGSTPWVLPISSSQCIVDGSSNHPSLYDFKVGAFTQCLGSFDSNTSLTPTNLSAVGMAQVTVGNYPLFIYSNQTSEGAGYNFNIVHNPSSFDFSKMEKLWTVPKNPLGDINHQYGLNSIATLTNDDGSATVFVYAPKNGLAVYRISLPELEISLNSPADNVTFEEDFDFSWNGVEGANYTLEISKTSTFENIVFEANTTATSYNSSNFNFASETQYFWRVKASHPNYTSKNSEVRSFISPQKKSAKDNLIIEERWLYNTSPLGDAAQRSMTAYNGNVYVITNSSGALLEFSGITGAYNRTITLKGDCFTNSSSTKLGIPTNCIFVDGNNNLCVSNLVTSFSTDNPLTVCTIDVNTGNTTRVFQSSVTATMRIDYANAFGDVTKEGGQIWGAVSANGTSNHNRIYRWTRNSNGSWTEDYTTIAKFYPTAGNIGGAPWVMPITETDFLVDGSGNAPTLYTFISKGNATYKSGFDLNKSLAPSYTTSGKAFGAGMNQITLGKFPLFIYNNDNFNGNGYNFTIVHNPSNYDFADMEYLWAIPDGYLGTEKHSTVLNSVATIKNDDNSATVFVYAPLNGLAAYRISLPEMNLSLTSPSNNETVEEAFDFKWTGISGSKYTLEVSTSETFDNLEFSEYTEANTYSPTDFKFKGSTKYYWRVTAENNNYTTTTSSVGSFIYPLKSGLKNELYYPNNNAKLNSDIVFICLKPYVLINNERHYADKTTLEISKDENFNDILIEFNGNWIEVASKEGIWCYQHTIPISYFANGTYYWRVRAEKDEYKEVISPIRQFIVKDQYDISTEYKMTRETASYPELSFGGNAYISCYNNWIRSSTYGNPISQANGGKYARGFCVRSDKNKDQNGKDIIYMHTDDDDALSLDYYNAANGEYLGTLDLTAAEGTTIAIKTFPCNGLFVDNAGNLCMYNLANTTTTDDVTTYVALQLCTIDVNIEKGTAIVTERFKVDAPIRFDHCHAYGDVANNKFTLFAAGNSTNIYRWTINGTSIKPEVKALASKAFGSNPYLHAVTNELVYIDGNGTNFALYDFENGVYKNQFTENLSKQVGGAVLIHNNATSFAIYPTNGVDNAHTFNISSIESILTGNTSANTRWSIPSEENALPPYNNKNTYYAHVDFLPKVNLENVSKSANINPNSSIIYLYVPGSGLASYSITSHIITGVEDIEAKNIKLGITNQEITFGCTVDSAQLYTLSGMLVNAVEDATAISKPFAQGVYILRITLDGVTSTHKIVLK